jgi:hypothetical protein
MRGIGAEPEIADSGRGLHAVQSNIHQRGADQSSNAMGNFCFEVSLSYRRLEQLPRVTGGE